jgi:hypothetical protein
MADMTTILAVRVNPAVKAAITVAAQRKYVPVPDYIRRLIVDGVTRDGGFDGIDHSYAPVEPLKPEVTPA